MLVQYRDSVEEVLQEGTGMNYIKALEFFGSHHLMYSAFCAYLTSGTVPPGLTDEEMAEAFAVSCRPDTLLAFVAGRILRHLGGY